MEINRVIVATLPVQAACLAALLNTHYTSRRAMNTCTLAAAP
jgi:hypothetical protein